MEFLGCDYNYGVCYENLKGSLWLYDVVGLYLIFYECECVKKRRNYICMRSVKEIYFFVSVGCSVCILREIIFIYM